MTSTTLPAASRITALPSARISIVYVPGGANTTSVPVTTGGGSKVNCQSSLQTVHVASAVHCVHEPSSVQVTHVPSSQHTGSASLPSAATGSIGGGFEHPTTSEIASAHETSRSSMESLLHAATYNSRSARVLGAYVT